VRMWCLAKKCGRQAVQQAVAHAVEAEEAWQQPMKRLKAQCERWWNKRVCMNAYEGERGREVCSVRKRHGRVRDSLFQVRGV